MKNVRSSQPCISMNSVKHKFFHVSIVNSFNFGFSSKLKLLKMMCYEKAVLKKK